MEIIGRDKISQSGNKAKMKIDNSTSQKSPWLARLLLGVLVAVIAGGLRYWFGWSS